MRRGIGRLRAATVGSVDTDAAAWAAAVVANGGTYSASTLSAVSAFCASAKASGYWTKLNRINLFCGNQLAAALVPLKRGGGSVTETNVNFVSGDYSEATGLTGNGSTKRLDTGLVANTLTLNDTHIAIYNRSSVAGGQNFSGADDNSTGFFVLGAPNAGAFLSYQGCAPASSLSSGAIGTPYGFLVGTRTASNAQAVYRNGTSAGSSSAASGTLPAQNFMVFARSGNGTPTDFGSNTFAAYSVGSGLSGTDVSNYYTHLQAFQTALGRNV